MWKSIFIVLLVIFVFDSAVAKGLPSYLKLCGRRAANIEKCVAENIELLRPHFKKGIPELFVPSMDPLVIPEATLDTGNQFKATFKNIELYNADNFKVEDLSFDLDKYRVGIKVTFPLLRIKAGYKIKGRLLVLSLNGQGPADGNYTNVEASVALKGVPFNKNNKEYIRWEKEKINISIGKTHLLFERIFGDNEELNDQTNKVINENFQNIIEELKPVIQDIATEFIFNIMNKLFSKYSLTELFIN